MPEPLPESTLSKPSRVDSSLLATDLDGTLIPLAGDLVQKQDLRQLADELTLHKRPIVFVTGRHLASVTQAIAEYQLPQPEVIIADVGTAIYSRVDGEGFRLNESYREHLQQLVACFPVAPLQELALRIDGLVLQDSIRQSPLKLSFFVDEVRREACVAELQQQLTLHQAPWNIIHGVDPFHQVGLVDLLPQNTSKAFALAWWCRSQKIDLDSIVFAGDSSNDLSVFEYGVRVIMVANADRQLAARVHSTHSQAGWLDRLYLAQRPATSGVLEGCRFFGLTRAAD